MQFSGLSSGEYVITHDIKDVDLLFLDKNHSFLTNFTKSEFWQMGNSNQISNLGQFSTNVVWTSSLSFSIYIGNRIVSHVPNIIVTFEYTKTTDTATT